MKIIDIRAARVGKSPIVRVVTDEGLDGLAEIEYSKPYVTQTLPLYRDALLGEDPTQVERCMMRIRRMGGFKPWGSAVSAIEIALWDLAGKALGAPVYKLLGGKVRDKVRTYRTFYHHEISALHTVSDYARWAAEATALPGGYKMFKLPSSFHSSMAADIPDYFYGELHNEAPYPYPNRGLVTEAGFEHAVAAITAAKEALGPGYGLAVDAGPGYLAYDALRFAKALEPLHLLWVEDMITGDYSPFVNADVYRDVTMATTTPIHTGEQIYLRQNFKDLIEKHAVDVIGPDPCDVGGIAELKWIAEFADLHGIAIAPHGTANGVFGLASLIQVAACLPDNYIAFEYPARFEADGFWYDIVDGFDGNPVVDGHIDVPDRPGLGVNFISEAAKAYLRPEDADFFD